MATTQERIIELRAERETRLSRVQELVERKNRLEEERRLLTEEENRLRVARNREGLTDAERKNLDLQLKAASARRAYASKQLSNLAPKIKGRIDYAKQIDSRIDRLSRSEDVRSRDKKTDERLAKEAEEQELSRRVSVAREVQAQRIASRQTKQEIPTREGIRVSSSFISLAKERGVINEEGKVIREQTIQPTTRQAPPIEQTSFAKKAQQIEERRENALRQTAQLSDKLFGKPQTKIGRAGKEIGKLVTTYPIEAGVLVASGAESLLLAGRGLITGEGDRKRILEETLITAPTKATQSTFRVATFRDPETGRATVESVTAGVAIYAIPAITTGAGRVKTVRATVPKESAVPKQTRAPVELLIDDKGGVTIIRGKENIARATDPQLLEGQIPRRLTVEELRKSTFDYTGEQRVAGAGVQEVRTFTGELGEKIIYSGPEGRAVAIRRAKAIARQERKASEAQGKTGIDRLIEREGLRREEGKRFAREQLEDLRNQNRLFGGSRKGQQKLITLQKTKPKSVVEEVTVFRRSTLQKQSVLEPLETVTKTIFLPRKRFGAVVIKTSTRLKQELRSGVESKQVTRASDLQDINIISSSKQSYAQSTSTFSINSAVVGSSVIGATALAINQGVLSDTFLKQSTQTKKQTQRKRKDLDFDFSGGLQDFTSSKRPRSDKRRKYLPSLTGIDRGIKATKKTATGFTGLELRGI